MAFKLEVTSKLPFFGRKAAAAETPVPAWPALKVS